MTDTTIRKSTRATITCVNETKIKKAGFPFVCTNKYEVKKNQIERKERGIAGMPLVLVTFYHNLMDMNRFWSYQVSLDG